MYVSCKYTVSCTIHMKRHVTHPPYSLHVFFMHVSVVCVLSSTPTFPQGARTYKKESGSRARGHALLIPDRPNCVTILSLGKHVP